ncbi:MAG: hypothetical protein HOC74_12340 [Gemmatimonadetes bacterium]|jgi:hypothetical protein|nr:hypothetical protein [Gemmatimonadota bacterium]
MRLAEKERCGLAWIQQWARGRLTQWKRARKYQPKGNLDEVEKTELQALLQIEEGAKTLLKEEN